MQIPFTKQQFFEVIEQYNMTVFPAFYGYGQALLIIVSSSRRSIRQHGCLADSFPHRIKFMIQAWP